MFYPRIKGEIERVIELVGFKSITIVRPSLIGGEREESRFREGIALRLMSIFAPILPKKLHVNPALPSLRRSWMLSRRPSRAAIFVMPQAWFDELVISPRMKTTQNHVKGFHLLSPVI
jgi:hypothetical protein